MRPTNPLDRLLRRLRRSAQPPVARYAGRLLAGDFASDFQILIVEVFESEPLGSYLAWESELKAIAAGRIPRCPATAWDPPGRCDPPAADAEELLVRCDPHPPAAARKGEWL